ncbi:hypothetical protein BGV71_32125 [Burkholderia ubonensis]|uniref:hypothetical protein n=1 Tax=Burkholderia ubonensis TaxID=101571 RepID=UPI0008FD9BAF|nr:hypothetical protein [Burkholderia ubonensis]OJA66144.1 hypothetical protein BGV71_32125 [Burkholderia ubonensis]
MATDTIDQKTLSGLIEAGAVRTAHVVGQRGGWGVLFKYGMTERPLATQRGHVRMWSKFETLAAYLRELGIVRFDVDAAQYDPDAPRSSAEQSKAERAREQMKTAHADAAYNKWFRETVKASIAEADELSSRKVPQAEVMVALQAGDTAALRALANGKPTAKTKRKASK